MDRVTKLLAPKATDKAYTAKDRLLISLIFQTDSYKFSHPYMFDELNKKARAGNKVVGMSSYGEARIPSSKNVVVFGGQMVLNKMFYRPITMADIDAAEKFALAHFGRPLFHRAGWEKVVKTYNGYAPVIIRALPDGYVARGGLPLYNITCLDPDLFWLSSNLETVLLRGYWYPTVVSSLDYDSKKKLEKLYVKSGADLAGLAFALHDFGGRGVTTGEQAESGGAAHLVNFMGSDTVEGILAANHYYDDPMAAFSVFATEHSVECSFGLDKEGEIAYLRAVLANAPEGSIVSVVIDGKDMWRCSEALCTSPLREEIIATKAKVVFRPDSGDMLEIVPRLIKLQEASFGFTTNDKGFKKINNVGIIYGDGVDRENLVQMVAWLVDNGYAADCMVFGSGGALLQKVNRDTMKFAQKGSALLLESGEWVGIAKDPVTDPGKKSKEGVLTTVKSRMTGELMAARLDGAELDSEWEDQMVLLYHTGTLYNFTTLSEVRARAA